MSVSDRWHTHKPRLARDPATGEPVPVQPCREHKLYAGADHGKGDRWQVRWRDDEGKQCKRNFAKLKGKDPNVHAEAFDAKISGELVTGTYIDPAAGKISLAAFATEWRKGQTGDILTLKSIDGKLKWICGPDIPLGKMPLAVLSRKPSAVQQWIKTLQEHPFAPTTIKGLVGTLSTILAAAIDDGLIARNPVKSSAVRRPTIPRRKVVPWTLAQIHAAAEAMFPRYEAIPYVGVGLGLRQGELFALAKEDIDWTRRVVHIRRQIRLVGPKDVQVFSLPKGDKERDVPLTDSLGQLLSEHIAEHGTHLVTLPWKVPDGAPHTATLLFVTVYKAAINRNIFNRGQWARARRAAKVPVNREQGMHVLRHTAASAWLAGGADIRSVAAFLGHEDPGFTLRIYMHLMPDAADRARKGMDEFFVAKDESAQNVPSEKETGS